MLAGPMCVVLASVKMFPSQLRFKQMLKGHVSF